MVRSHCTIWNFWYGKSNIRNVRYKTHLKSVRHFFHPSLTEAKGVNWQGVPCKMFYHFLQQPAILKILKTLTKICSCVLLLLLLLLMVIFAWPTKQLQNSKLTTCFLSLLFYLACRVCLQTRTCLRCYRTFNILQRTRMRILTYYMYIIHRYICVYDCVSYHPVYVQHFVGTLCIVV